jgi:hypothetical protein
VEPLSEHSRITREKIILDAMVHIYCHAHHNTKDSELCVECSKFMDYSKMRLDKCPFQEKKSTCGKCLIYCYQSPNKEQAKIVMMYAGPRMLTRHPGLSIQHIVDGFRKLPKKPLEKRNFLRGFL